MKIFNKEQSIKLKRAGDKIRKKYNGPVFEV